jgi:CheY-like chemotaxis protein
MKPVLPATILLVDDDEDDREMTIEALRKSGIANDVHIAVDGEEMMDYLFRRGRPSRPPYPPVPGLILLDLNMPGKDGWEALAELKSDPELHKIPVVVLTTSVADEDIFRSYDLGVNSFITKPLTFSGLAEAMSVLAHYWFEISELPDVRSRRPRVAS